MPEVPKRPRGRPKGSTKLKLGRFATVKVLASDLDTIKMCAGMSGRTISEFVGYLARDYFLNKLDVDVAARKAAIKGAREKKSEDKSHG